MVLFKTLPLCPSVSWNVAYGFYKVKFLCDASILTVDKGICLWDAGRALGRCLIFRVLRVLEVLALLQTGGLKVALKRLTHDQSLSPSVLVAIYGGWQQGLRKFFLFAILPCLFFFPEDMIPRCLVTYKRHEAKIRHACCWRKPFKAKGAWHVALAQNILSWWLWASFQLWSCGPTLGLQQGQVEHTMLVLLVLQGELMTALKGGKLKYTKDEKVNHIILWEQQAWPDSLSCCFHVTFFFSCGIQREKRDKVGDDGLNQDGCNHPGTHSQVFGPYFCYFFIPKSTVLGIVVGRVF